MAAKALTVTVRIAGVRETLDRFRELPKDASAELRTASMELAQTLARTAQAAGRAEGRQAAIVAGTVAARRDRVPVIVAGGTRRIGRHRKPAYALLFGSEFGSNRLKQYRPHLGRGSYWFFKSVERSQAEIAAEWQRAADRIVARFGEGGGS